MILRLMKQTQLHRPPLSFMVKGLTFIIKKHDECSPVNNIKTLNFNGVSWGNLSSSLKRQPNEVLSGVPHLVKQLPNIFRQLYYNKALLNSTLIDKNPVRRIIASNKPVTKQHLFKVLISLIIFSSME